MSQKLPPKTKARYTAIRNILQHAYDEAGHFKREEDEETAKAFEETAKYLEARFITWL